MLDLSVLDLYFIRHQVDFSSRRSSKIRTENRYTNFNFYYIAIVLG